MLVIFARMYYLKDDSVSNLGIFQKEIANFSHGITANQTLVVKYVTLDSLR